MSFALFAFAGALLKLFYMYFLDTMHSVNNVNCDHGFILSDFGYVC